MKHKRKLKGIIVSHATSKTAIVEVERYFEHPFYRKYIKRSKRYKAHDERGAYQVGSSVIIEESRPFSKDKKWVIKEFVHNLKQSDSAHDKP